MTGATPTGGACRLHSAAQPSHHRRSGVTSVPHPKHAIATSRSARHPRADVLSHHVGRCARCLDRELPTSRSPGHRDGVGTGNDRRCRRWCLPVPTVDSTAAFARRPVQAAERDRRHRGVGRSDYPKPMRARRTKAVAKIQTLVGEQGTCRMYGFGVVGPEPTRSWLWIVGATIALVVLLVLTTGVLLVPGVIGLGVVRWVVNRPRGVGVADQGIVVTHESFWNASPTSIVVFLPLDALSVETASTRSHVRLRLGAEQVWLRRNEYDLLIAAKDSART